MRTYPPKPKTRLSVSRLSTHKDRLLQPLRISLICHNTRMPYSKPENRRTRSYSQVIGSNCITSTLDRVSGYSSRDKQVSGFSLSSVGDLSERGTNLSPVNGWRRPAMNRVMRE